MDKKEMNMAVYKLVRDRRESIARLVVQQELNLAGEKAYQQAEKLLEEQDTYGLGNKFRREDPVPKLEEKLAKAKQELQEWDEILEYTVRTFV